MNGPAPHSLSDGRALIAFDGSMTPAQLELEIEDEPEDRALPPEDAQVFSRIRELLRNARRSQSVVLCQPSIIVLEHRSNKSGRK